MRRSVIACCLIFASVATATVSPVLTPEIITAPQRFLASVKPPSPQAPTSLNPGQVAAATSGVALIAGAAAGCVPATVAGLMTAAIVTAPVNILDIAIMENASGKRKIGAALAHGMERLSSDPMGFAKSPESALTVRVHLCHREHLQTPCVAHRAFPHRHHRRQHGTKKDFPLLSYASLAARDSLAMGSSFTLPPIIGKAMIATMGVPAAFANNFAQLFTPVVAQTVQVPFHLLALSLYNNPEMTIKERTASMKSLYTETLWARMARVLPCYGAGGVINNGLKARLAASPSAPPAPAK
eukprot:CAMPEP_0177748386 /NCGR_PEP_ID=MMETSP0484_2-20121128/31904_1 /TAXON_ID=354590 /ORGANISM="Rhodomonas lens, Strain RHODO" /LENGTH=297 /DNA_ID=CAMNT_0019263257 /DNA_START=38 /DNA_END=932 /DNA_ORIENTATION=+